MKQLSKKFLSLAATLLFAAASTPWTPDIGGFDPHITQAAEPTIDELLKGYDDMLRGDSSDAVVTMNIKNARWERSITMKMLSKGQDKSLIQVMAPAKDKGTTTLKVDDNLWNYMPKVDRTIKLPSAMMSSSWMGSHFTNDDLVKDSRVSEDFDHKILNKPDDNPDKLYIIELTPKPDTPVVWGKIILSLRGTDHLPTKVQYFDEKGTAVRTMEFEDFKELDGRTVATKMRLIPEDKEGEFTEIIYEKLKFNTEIPDSAFTLQALKR